MGQKHVNLIKLCVGVDSVAHLAAFRAVRAAEDPNYVPMHVTRMWPKRSDELLNGGSLYWVIKGAVQVRQRIVRLDEVIGTDGIRRCGIVMDPELIRTATAARRPFQGWRYLSAEDAPIDLPKTRDNETQLPQDLAEELNRLGLR